MALDNAMGIVDVVDFEVQKFGTRDLLFSVDYAESVGISFSAERLEIRGGIGNPIRITAHHSKSGEFTSSLPLVDISALGVKLGKATVKGATTAPASDKLSVDTSKVELKQTPITGTLKVYVLESNGRDIKNELTVGTPATEVSEYSITGKTITVNSGLTTGTYIKCVYDYTTGADAQRVRVTAKDFGGDVRISGRGYALDESGNKAPVAFIVHRASPAPDFEMTFQAGEATSTAFNCTMMPTLIDAEDVFFDIIPLDNETF